MSNVHYQHLWKCIRTQNNPLMGFEIRLNSQCVDVEVKSFSTNCTPAHLRSQDFSSTINPKREERGSSGWKNDHSPPRAGWMKGHSDLFTVNRLPLCLQWAWINMLPVCHVLVSRLLKNLYLQARSSSVYRPLEHLRFSNCISSLGLL